MPVYHVVYFIFCPFLLTQHHHDQAVFPEAANQRRQQPTDYQEDECSLPQGAERCEGCGILRVRGVWSTRLRGVASLECEGCGRQG